MDKTRQFESPSVQLRMLDISMNVELFELFQSILTKHSMSSHLPWIAKEMPTVEAVSGFIISKQKKEAEGVEFTRVIKHGPEIAGILTYKPDITSPRIVEIGYFLGLNFVGKSIARLALQTITNELVAKDLIPVLYIENTNIASHFVAASVGYSRTIPVSLHGGQYFQYVLPKGNLF
jgi:RimJ/RimL family protein N-acetyltransferase